jgi:hypothetical protein
VQLGEFANLEPVPYEEAKAFAEEHGFDDLGPLTAPSLRDDPHHTRPDGRLSLFEPINRFGKFRDYDPRPSSRTRTKVRPRTGMLNIAANPRLPTLAEAMRQALTPEEADHLSAHPQPLVEQGHSKQRIAVSYLSALRL